MNPETDDKKGGLIRRSKELLDTAMGGLKGRDMNALMDEFTQEMTVVAEGLSEVLTLAQRDLAQLSAAQTILEEGRAKDRRELSDRLDAIEKRLTSLEKQREKGQKRGGLSQVLRQVTVIAAIIAGAWVLVTVLNLLGGS